MDVENAQLPTAGWMAQRFVSALRFAPTSAIQMSGLWIAMGVRHTRAPRFAGELAQVMTKLDHAEAVVSKKTILFTSRDSQPNQGYVPQLSRWR